jgi:hypothetical protein
MPRVTSWPGGTALKTSAPSNSAPVGVTTMVGAVVAYNANDSSTCDLWISKPSPSVGGTAFDGWQDETALYPNQVTDADMHRIYVAGATP